MKKRDLDQSIEEFCKALPSLVANCRKGVKLLSKKEHEELELFIIPYVKDMLQAKLLYYTAICQFLSKKKPEETKGLFDFL